MTASVVDWLTASSYLVVFIGTAIDASGLPFPGRMLLVAAGALAGTGRVDLAGVFAAALAAVVLMDHFWYLAGAWESQRILRLYQRLSGASRRAADVEMDYFTRYGAATILLGRFFASIRVLTWPVAAARGIGYARFVILDVAAASLWVGLWVLLGWAVGDRWMSAAETAGTWLAIAGGLLLVVTVAPLAVRVWRRRHRRRAQPSSAAARPH